MTFSREQRSITPRAKENEKSNISKLEEPLFSQITSTIESYQLAIKKYQANVDNIIQDHLQTLRNNDLKEKLKNIIKDENHQQDIINELKKIRQHSAELIEKEINKYKEAIKNENEAFNTKLNNSIRSKLQERITNAIKNQLAQKGWIHSKAESLLDEIQNEHQSLIKGICDEKKQVAPSLQQQEQKKPSNVTPNNDAVLNTQEEIKENNSSVNNTTPNFPVIENASNLIYNTDSSTQTLINNVDNTNANDNQPENPNIANAISPPENDIKNNDEQSNKQAMNFQTPEQNNTNDINTNLQPLTENNTSDPSTDTDDKNVNIAEQVNDNNNQSEKPDIANVPTSDKNPGASPPVTPPQPPKTSDNVLPKEPLNNQDKTPASEKNDNTITLHLADKKTAQLITEIRSGSPSHNDNKANDTQVSVKIQHTEKDAKHTDDDKCFEGICAFLKFHEKAPPADTMVISGKWDQTTIEQIINCCNAAGRKFELADNLKIVDGQGSQLNNFDQWKESMTKDNTNSNTAKTTLQEKYNNLMNTAPYTDQLKNSVFDKTSKAIFSDIKRSNDNTNRGQITTNPSASRANSIKQNEVPPFNALVETINKNANSVTPDNNNIQPQKLTHR